MSMLVPPQMMNTMVRRPTGGCRRRCRLHRSFLADPVRRYCSRSSRTAARTGRRHPHATRDSLHEHDMWVTEGLTHRYPTKVLAELLPTCPQYCGHCNRMDLVGNSTPQVTKLKLAGKPVDRYSAMLGYLGTPPGRSRDVVVSGGDVDNMPWKYLGGVPDASARGREHPRRPARTRRSWGLPQHLARPRRRRGWSARRAGRPAAWRQPRDPHPRQQRPSRDPAVAAASRAMLDAGVRDVRNQGVLMRGVNDTPEQLLDLCFALQDDASVTPTYSTCATMIPFSEHWRVSLATPHLQHAMMGYLPGFATPRIVCDVPFVGKRWVHQVEDYDTEAASRSGARTTAPRSRATTPRRCRATTSTTTRSTRSPRRAAVVARAVGCLRRGGEGRRRATRSRGPSVSSPRPSWAEPARGGCSGSGRAQPAVRCGTDAARGGGLESGCSARPTDGR